MQSFVVSEVQLLIPSALRLQWVICITDLVSLGRQMFVPLQLFFCLLLLESGSINHQMQGRSPEIDLEFRHQIEI